MNFSVGGGGLGHINPRKLKNIVHWDTCLLSLEVNFDSGF